jgi:hypothetical protein
LVPTSGLPLSASQVNDSEELCDALDFTGSQSETSDPPVTDTTVASDEPQPSGVEHTSESGSIDSDLFVFSYTGTSQSEPVGATESIEFTTFSDVDKSTGPPYATEIVGTDIQSTTEPSSTDSTLETISLLEVTSATDEPKPFTSENINENLEDLPVRCLMKFLQLQCLRYFNESFVELPFISARFLRHHSNG